MLPTLNDAAADLWSQIFANIAAHPGAAIMDPEHDVAADEKVMRAGFAAAGWSEQESEAIAEANRVAETAAPTTSPGASRAVEARHALLCDAVEAEMARRGMSSQVQVARGIEPRVRPYACKTGVIMTDQSIIAVGSFTYRFCGLIAKAFVRTLMLNPFIWDSESFSVLHAKGILRSNPRVLLYWVQIYLGFSVTGTNATVPFRPSTKKEIILVEQVARAMEIFMVAHEYGHHHFGHGRDINANPHDEEYEADRFALRIGRPLGEAEVFPNPYLASGAGGIILLKSLMTLRKSETVFGGRVSDEDTHPAVDQRISKFDNVALLEPVIYPVLKGFRTASCRLMDLVDEMVVSFFQQLPSDEYSALTRMRADLIAQVP